jgi:hypothetical protein
MHSGLSVFLTAASAVALMAPGPPAASATPAASLSSPAPTTAAACAYPTVTFNGAAYCPATIVGVRNTVYGLGSRVVLKGVTVTKAVPGSSTVTVAAWTSPPCPPGKFCGQLLTLESLIVPWTGTSRPVPGDVLDLFGKTITGTITPVGYVKTGFCPIEWC